MQKKLRRNWFIGIGVLLGVGMVIGLIFWGAEAYLARKWDGKQRFTIVELSSPLTILSFDPATSEGIRVVLPDNLEINSLAGRGRWKAESMSQTAKKFGRVWASDSVCDYLAVPCTAISSDLTLWDKYLWWKWSRDLRWKTVNLAETPYVREVEAPDGEKETILAPGWEEKAYEWFASGSVIRENINVTIINATAVSGLGTHAARTVETAGMKVVMVKNASEKINKCQIEANEITLKTLGVTWMQKKFGCETRVGEAHDQEVIVTMGEEYAKWLLGEDYSSASGISVN